MKDLLTYIAKSLVEHPDAVNVTEVNRDDSLVLELRVSPDDMGKVIGKHGRIAKEIRSIIKAAALKDNIKVSVDIVD